MGGNNFRLPASPTRNVIIRMGLLRVSPSLCEEHSQRAIYQLSAYAGLQIVDSRYARSSAQFRTGTIVRELLFCSLIKQKIELADHVSCVPMIRLFETES